MDLSRLDYQAQALVRRLVVGSENRNLGSATVAFYDTAWVSMVSKIHQGQNRWLFPESFRFLLDNQLPDGGWKSYASRDDGLLNTLAALLAMKKHTNALKMMDQANVPSLENRIVKAKRYIQESLRDWDVDASMHVGFEILVPALLSMLDSEGLRFDFPGRRSLDRLNATKLAKFDPEVLYSSPKTSAHSLEAFIGRIDFDRLTRHKTFGSMMASPASTAAYLMQCSTWDNEAESYIRRVICEGMGKGNGGLPSVFPTPIFEVTWIISTLLQSGFTKAALGEYNLERIAVYLLEHLRNQQGLVGFAPCVPADADDTAKALLTLNLLKKQTSPESMINHFRSKYKHFLTYPGERDASFSANCNVLKALLESPDVNCYKAEVSSIASFLCDSWWSGAVKDKWNLSLQYSMLLLAEALVRLLEIWDSGILDGLQESLLQDRIPVVLIQILNRTLLSQKGNGTWDPVDCPEATAYGVLTLSALCRLPETPFLQTQVTSAIQAGQSILDQSRHEWTKPQYLWIEKVTYGSHNLSEAYCLAAMKPKSPSNLWSEKVKNIFDIPTESISTHSKFLATIGVFEAVPFWKIQASVVEGYTFLPQLKAAGTDVLPLQEGAKNEYLNLIPCTWTMVNHHNHLFLSADILWDMMVLTVCNFRVDEYMETIGAKLMEENLEQAEFIIHDLCTVEGLKKRMTAVRPSKDSVEAPSNREHSCTASKVKTAKIETCWGTVQTNRTDTVIAEANEEYSISPLASFRAVIGHYIRATLQHSQVLGASSADHSNVRSLLCAFLLSHVAQISDNSRFASQALWNPSATTVFASPRTSFYTWAHTTGADSISCPFSFAFFTCLLGVAAAPKHTGTQKQADDCFTSMHQKYLAQDLCAHLAVMSRLYNDFGSVVRDRIEANINSTNFPEFHVNMNDLPISTDEKVGLTDRKMLKEELLRLAEHERKCADLASERLLKTLESKEIGVGRESAKLKADGVRLFLGVTSLYADLYVARDLSNQVKFDKPSVAKNECSV